MKLFKKILLAVACTLAIAESAQAVVVNVGGVVWDTDAVSLTDSDFTARFEFNQFFTSAVNAVPDVPNAPANYANAIDPTTTTLGDVLQGVGEVFRFNGVNYGDTSSPTGGTFCPSCELTFTFGGFSVTGPDTLSNGWLRLYVDDAPDFDVSTSPAANAADGTLFLELRGVANEFSTSGGFQSGSLFNYFAVAGGIAAPNFDTNTQLFASDLLSSASATFFGGQSVATSTGQIFGDSVAAPVPVPEPAPIFLLGIAMLGFAWLRRKGLK
ncbi:MAG: PEP-CTERM sorting domain-containing protein [Pseudomonadota bacterium]